MELNLRIVNDTHESVERYDFRFVRIPAGFGCEEFLMLEAPVTRREWELVMGEGTGEKGSENFPKTNVSWEDCEKFCKKLGEKLGKTMRMPTELEWCRAVGEEPEKLEEFAVFDAKKLMEVRTRRPNEFGLYDMRGLVWEWMSYGRGLESEVCMRGGSWFDDRSLARAVGRLCDLPAVRNVNIGFRVVSVDSQKGGRD